MKEIIADAQLVSRCGLYCGACKSYLKEKCPGCTDNEKATWCKVRTCTLEKNIAHCGACEIDDLFSCKKLDNPISKVIGFLTRADKERTMNYLKINGAQKYAKEMTTRKKMFFKKGDL
jgi:hypothetical protein